jgi:hypothetical protein
VFLYTFVYDYSLCVARDRSGQWRVHVSPDATPSGFPARKGFLLQEAVMTMCAVSCARNALNWARPSLAAAARQSCKIRIMSRHFFGAMRYRAVFLIFASPVLATFYFSPHSIISAK